MIRTILALLLTAYLFACGDDEGSRDTGPLQPADGGIDFASFDEELRRAIDRYNSTSDGGVIRGASAVVVTKEDGLVHSKGYGEFAAERTYLIASSSKILGAGVLMRLQDQGKLDVNKPISEYLGAWGEHKSNVTVAELLSNSSGLPSLVEIAASAAQLTPAVLMQYGPHFCQYMKGASLSDCGRSIYQDDQPNNNRPPDTTFRYGGSQWQLAGAIAEQVSGKKWADLMRETYVDTCGAASLGVTNQFDGAQLGYPPYFQGNPANAPATENPSIEGGAYISGPDYAKVLLMHLRDGKCGDTRVLSADAVKTMQTDRVTKYGGSLQLAPDMPTPYVGYGLGWWIAKDHIADPGAYGAYPLLDLKRGYGAMILIELESSVGSAIALSVKPTLDAIMDAR